MIKYLSTHGNSMALVIEKAILELLHITPDTPLDIRTDGECLIVTPAQNQAHKRKVQEASERVNKRHASTFKALAG